MARLNAFLSRKPWIANRMSGHAWILALLLWISTVGVTLAAENAEFPAMAAGFIGSNDVYLTNKGSEAPPLKNELVFYIQSALSPSGQMPAAIPANANRSYIKLFFEYGGSLGDLATKEEASAFEFSVVRDYGNAFTIEKHPEGIIPYWKLTARSTTFLNGGNQNRIELKFSNIYSYLGPGLTTLHIEYGHEKDKPSGAMGLAIVKRKPAALDAKFGLKVDGPLNLQTGTAVSKVSNEETLKANSDHALPTEKAVKTYVDRRLPAGVIVMWSGAADAIPPGWALCNGQPGTPNLQNRFILGAGTRKVDEYDGEEDVVLSVDQMPSHSHSGHVDYVDHTPAYVTEKINNWLNTSRKYSNNVKAETKKAAVALDPAGQGQAHNNMPPYYVLAFIMKLP